MSQRALVLDYLSHNCYSATAKVFAEESTVRELDADGDEVMLPHGEFSELSEPVLKEMKLRERMFALIIYF
jgi:Cu/Ag efflux protein CusF